MHTSKLSLAIVLSALFFWSWQSTPVQAQTVISGSTVDYNGQVYTLGASNSLQTLLITSGGRLINAEDIIIGEALNANSNQVTVTGPNSVMWANTSLLVGRIGSFNSLIISNGANVSDQLGDIGYGVSTQTSNDVIGAEGNYVVVTGAGSTWTNYSYLLVGDWGPNNSLTVADGGYVYVGADSFMGGQDVFDDAGTGKGDNNSALITGTNSTWETVGTLHVGYRRSGNSVTVENGGQLLTGAASVGFDVTASNNVVRLSGAGTVWVNDSAIVIGASGYASSVEVSNGAQVFTVTTMLGADGNRNQLLLSDTDTVWLSSGTFTVGGNGSDNSVLVQNQALLLTGDAILGSTSDSTNNVITIDDAEWYSSGQIVVGSAGTRNRLLINQNGYVESSSGVIGLAAGANNNSVTLNGAGAAWYNEFELVVGWAGNNNTLRVGSGTSLASGDSHIGRDSGASQNSVSINGGQWLVDGALFVGNAGSDNQLTINNNGTVWAADLWIGNSVGGNANLVTVSGASATLGVLDTLAVGNGGSFNRLEINSGASVTSEVGIIGNLNGSSGNSVSVSSDNSSWSVAQELYVGFSGSGNNLTISGGALVENGQGYIGFLGSGNSLDISGNGSVWRNNGDLTIGAIADNNQMTVQNGAVVYSEVGTIGNLGDNNQVSVAGAGSRWLNTTALLVGVGGANNSLLVSNRGVVQTPNLTIGLSPLYDGNAVNLKPGGTLLVTNGGSGELVIGYGALNLQGGTVLADQVLLPNAGGGQLVFSSGILTAGVVLAQNGSPFIVGDGTGSAQFILSEAPSTFADGLVIAEGGYFAGSGTGLTLTGNYLQQSGGTLRLGVVDTLEFQQLAITGEADLNGVLQVVQTSDWTPAEGDSIVLLSATGGRTNEFASFQNFTALWANLIYGADTVSLQWTNILLVSYAQTPNQKAVAQAIDDALPDVRLATVLALINDSLGTNETPALLDAIAPEELGALFLVPVASMDAFGNQFRSRVNSLRTGSRGFDASRIRLIDWEEGGSIFQPPSAPLKEPVLYSWGDDLDPLSPSPRNPWGFYIDGAGTFLKVNDTPNAKGFDSTASGMTLGADRWMTPNLVLGATLGYAGDSSGLADGGELEADGARGSIYGAYLSRGWHLEGMLAGSWHSIETRRDVAGSFAEGETEATTFSILVGGGHDWNFDRLTVGPEALVQFTSVQLNGFTEKGSAAPMSIEEDTFDAFRTQLGMRASYRMVWGENTVVLPYGSAAWRHDFLDDSVPINAQFASGAGDQFTVHSAELGSDSLALAVGVSIQWNLQFNTYLGYSTEVGREGYQLHNVNGGFRFNF